MIAKITAPYNFVPLSGWVHHPDWAHAVSQDLPFEKGISGVFEIEIKAETPLMIGGKREPGEKGRSSRERGKPGKVWFYQTPDGAYVIPGTSIKGALRNVLEIATFAKMRLIDHNWHSLRDLTSGTSELYRRHFNNHASRAGWLRFDPSQKQPWLLTRTSYTRVKHSDLINYHPREIKDLRNRNPSPIRYAIWGDNSEIDFDLVKGRDKKNREIIDPAFGLAKNLGKGKTRGRLVLTGQPADGGGTGKKNVDYIFFDEQETIPLAESTMRAFLNIHEGTDEWQFWNSRLESEPGVPVFYLPEGRKIRAMGLAKMFRLAYRYSLAEVLENTNPQHRGPEPDLVELLFGVVQDQPLPEGNLKGRVNFGLARLQNPAQVIADIPPMVLNGPKPSYFPNYVDQPHAEGNRLPDHPNRSQKSQYRTYSDTDAELRGWKRYPVRPWSQPIGDASVDNDFIQAKLFPLGRGACFRTKVRVHNLLPVELGALVWGLTWGGDDQLRHALGMGKPFGLGRVNITIDPTAWQGLRPHRESLKKPADYRSLFESHMEGAWSEATPPNGGTWIESEQLRQLLAMADPRQGEDKDLVYPILRRNPNIDQFREAKNQKLVLEPYAKHHGPKDPDLFPRTPRQERERLERDARADKLKSEEKKEREHQLAQELQRVPLLGREAYTDLFRKGECRAVHWVQQLEEMEPAEATAVAEVLWRFFKKIGKASSKNPKQLKKMAAIKKHWKPPS